MIPDQINNNIIPENSSDINAASPMSSPFWTFSKSMKVYLVGAILGTIFSIISGIYLGGLWAPIDLSMRSHGSGGGGYIFLNKPLITYVALPFLCGQIAISMVFFFGIYKQLKQKGEKGNIAAAGLVLLVISYFAELTFLYQCFLIASGHPPTTSSVTGPAWLSIIAGLVFFILLEGFLLIGLLAGVIWGIQILSNGRTEFQFTSILLVLGLFIYPMGIVAFVIFILLEYSRIKQVLSVISESRRKLRAFFRENQKIQVVTAISGITVAAVIFASLLFPSVLNFGNSITYVLFIYLYIYPISQFAAIASFSRLFRRRAKIIRDAALALYLIPLLILGILKSGVLNIYWLTPQLLAGLIFTQAFLNCGLLLGGLFAAGQYKLNRGLYESGRISPE